MGLKRSKNLELNTLQQFSVVAGSETITQAAKRLGISQSAVSQTIKQLEEQTEVELIVRRSKPIKLTPSGEILKRYAMRMLSDSSRVMNDIRMAASGGLSHLRVGMIDSYGEALGLEFIREIKPMIRRVTLQLGFRSSLVTALKHRDIDVLITSDQNENHR
jgi:DNA-binding transcriptional LysR family regulator